MRQITRKNPVKSCENLCHPNHLPFFSIKNHKWLLFPSNPTIETILKGFPGKTFLTKTKEEGRRGGEKAALFPPHPPYFR